MTGALRLLGKLEKDKDLGTAGVRDLSHPNCSLEKEDCYSWKVLAAF